MAHPDPHQPAARIIGAYAKGVTLTDPDKPTFKKLYSGVVEKRGITTTNTDNNNNNKNTLRERALMPLKVERLRYKLNPIARIPAHKTRVPGHHAGRCNCGEKIIYKILKLTSCVCTSSYTDQDV